MGPPTERSTAQPASFAFGLTPIRESKLLGKRMIFERSTALGLSPETFMRAMAGMSWQQFLENENYSLYRALVAMGRSETLGSKLQSRTLEDLGKGLGSGGMSLDKLKAIPNGLSTPWRMLLRTLRHSLPRIERRVLARLAYFDRLAMQITNTTDRECVLHMKRQVFFPSVMHWHLTGLDLTWESAVVLDVTLHHLAWLDIDIASRGPENPDWIIALVDPPKQPMRHWFDELLRAAKCENLVELHDFTTRRGATRYKRPITHDLLKKWASTERLLPVDAAVELLIAFADEDLRSKMQTRLLIARLLTVLVELVRSFSEKPVASKTAQIAIHERLLSLRAAIQAASGAGPLFLF
jgi:heme oxygenase